MSKWNMIPYRKVQLNVLELKHILEIGFFLGE